MTIYNKKKEQCTHIWKYIKNGQERICESPFEFLVRGCGKKEVKIKGVYK